MLDKIHRRQIDFGPLQYFEPLAEEPPGNQIRIREGWLKNEDVLVHQAEQFTVGFTVVPTANHVRWDLVYLGLDGLVTVIPGTVQFSSVPLYTGAPDPPAYSYPLAYVFVNEAGSVIVTESDITDLRPKLNFLYNSDFANEYSIDIGDKPHEADEKLSLEDEYAGDFTGKSNQGRGTYLPDYTSRGSHEYAIADDMPLEEGIAVLDLEAERVKTFLGKTDIAEELPDYSAFTTHHNISPNDPVNAGVGKLDTALYALQISGTVGSVLLFANSTPPSGFLECNGGTYLIATYAALYAKIGVTYGGDGLTTFRVPDLRGRFIRGWDHGVGRDPDRGSRTNYAGAVVGDVVGSLQTDQVRSHTHPIPWMIYGTPTHYGDSGENWTYGPSNTGAYGGNETRPANMYLMPCIKY